jgi:hypothetical protein
LKQQLESGLAQIIYNADDISAKRAAALEAYLIAEGKSEKNRYKKKEPPKEKIEPFE